MEDYMVEDIKFKALLSAYVNERSSRIIKLSEDEAEIIDEDEFKHADLNHLIRKETVIDV